MIRKSNYANTTLTGGLPLRKRMANIRYVMELDDEVLLYNYRQEAGLASLREFPEDFHYGWEMPTCQLRGHFTGHWMSAAARLYAITGDDRIKAKLAYMVREIAKCQKENGGQWCFTIPEKYLWWIRNGKRVWAPHYTVHKILMGLCDAKEYAGIDEAVGILSGAAQWFLAYTDGISREEMDDLMDRTETGGIMEAWADLYRISGDPQHLELMRRYERPRYYEALLLGEDVLTNCHANTTIPEILGVCKAYEITGEQRYLAIAKAYWNLAVEERGYYATGGQTSGEVWSPLKKQAERLSNKNQEHCTVYNMMRLAEFLYRQEGGVQYADYWERNLYNGIFAQGYYETHYRYSQSEDIENNKEILTYFLPLEAGAKKRWGTKRDHFWCCHGSLVQANATMLQDGIYYAAGKEATVCQYFPSATVLKARDLGLAADVYLEQAYYDGAYATRPKAMNLKLSIRGAGQIFMLRIRIPWWVDGKMQLHTEDGKQISYTEKEGYACIDKEWRDETICVHIPKTITVHPLDDRPDCAAFLDGPVVLAGLTEQEIALYGDIDQPAGLFIADDERQWGVWNLNWRTVDQPVNIRFTPLYNICYQRYTTYFPIKKN
ncbi:MAG: beta-L-arabinofuranosidase domain-containing protein [Christensenellales bacterium]|jgi:DUF1680 family protein